MNQFPKRTVNDGLIFPHMFRYQVIRPARDRLLGKFAASSSRLLRASGILFQPRVRRRDTPNSQDGRRIVPVRDAARSLRRRAPLAPVARSASRVSVAARRDDDLGLRSRSARVDARRAASRSPRPVADPLVRRPSPSPPRSLREGSHPGLQAVRLLADPTDRARASTAGFSRATRDPGALVEVSGRVPRTRARRRSRRRSRPRPRRPAGRAPARSRRARPTAPDPGRASSRRRRWSPDPSATAPLGSFRSHLRRSSGLARPRRYRARAWR